MNFTAQSVLQLAPDDASAKAAKGLISPAKWGASLGFTERAVWGECQGSGSKPYQTQVDLSSGAPSFKCSCPSRKFPCKHGLALLLLKADSEKLFKQGAEPDWVSGWIESKLDRAQKKQEKAEAIANDPQASAKAAASSAKKAQGRWERIEEGLGDLERFLVDQLTVGLASLGSEAMEGWGRMAARMVDAQAPYMGEVLKNAASIVGNDANWPTKVLEQMGHIQLCIEAVRRRESLPPDLLADLQSALGWSIDTETAISKGIKVEDVWLVIGSVSEVRDARMSERRTWLHGVRSGQRALVLEYSIGGKGYERAWEVGSALAGTLAFYQSAAPLRAVPQGAMDIVKSPAFDQWPAGTMDDEWKALAGRIASNPFSFTTPMVLSEVVVSRHDDKWLLHSKGEGALPALELKLSESTGWDLLASSAGDGMKLAGEWDGTTFAPTLALCREGALIF